MSGDCERVPNDVPLHVCPLQVENDIWECIDELVYEDWSHEEALTSCNENTDVLDFYDSLCDDSFTTPSDFCAKGEDVFSEHYLPNCTTKIDKDINASSDAVLTAVPVSSELEALIEQGNIECEDWCTLEVQAFTYESTASDDLTGPQAINALKVGGAVTSWLRSDGLIENGQFESLSPSKLSGSSGMMVSIIEQLNDRRGILLAVAS